MTHYNHIEGSNALSIYDANGSRVSIEGYSNDWSVIGGAIGFSDSEILDIFHISMAVAPSSTGAVQFSLTPIAIEGLSSDFVLSMLGHIQVKVDATATVVGVLTQFGQPLPEGKYAKSVTVSKNSWTTCRTNSLEYEPTTDLGTSFAVTYTITGHEGKVVYVTLPALHDRNSYLSNPYVSTARNYIPDFMWDIDQQQDDPNAPLFKLVDILSHDASQVMRAYSQIFSYEPAELGPEFNINDSEYRSGLTDPEYHYTTFRKWLAQFTGGPLVYNIGVREPLQSEIAMVALGTNETDVLSIELFGNAEASMNPITWLSAYPEGAEFLERVSEGFAAGEVTIQASTQSEGLFLTFTDTESQFNIYGELDSGGSLLTNLSEGAILRWRIPGQPWRYVHMGQRGALASYSDIVSASSSTVQIWYSAEWSSIASMTDLKNDHSNRLSAVASTTASSFEDLSQLEIDIGWFTDDKSLGPVALIKTTHASPTGLIAGLDTIQQGDGIAIWDEGTSSWIKAMFDDYYYAGTDPTSGDYTYAIWFTSVIPNVSHYWIDTADSYVSRSYRGPVERLFQTENEVNEFQKWQIANAYYGYKAGTGDALAESARLVLTGDTRVAILPNYKDNPFAIEVRTITSATPYVDPATGSSTAVSAVIEPARPMGYSLVSTTADEFYLTLGSPGLGLLDFAVLG